MDQAAKTKADWFGYADFSPGGLHHRFDDAADNLARRWNWDESDLAQAVYPDQPARLRETALKGLNLDLARAVVCGLALAPDGIHAPLLAAKVERSDDVESQPAGSAALEMLLPNIKDATWSDIAAIRKDPGLTYLRDRLREREAGAGSERLLEAAVRDALVTEVGRKTPNWGSTAVKATFSVIVSPIPVMGDIATAVGSAKDVADTWKERKHWTAALVRARKRLDKRNK
jgi:hypothetical protein